MARRGQHDSSPGDGRTPFSDEGGTDETPQDDFDADLHGSEPIEQPGIVPGQRDAEGVKDLRTGIGEDLDPAEFARLTIVAAGVSLDEGGTFLDLDDLPRGEWSQHGKHEVAPGERIVSKKETDYELWNRLRAMAPAAGEPR